MKRLFQPEIDLRLLELPGHGSRIHERLLNNFHEMVTDIVTQIQNMPSFHFAFWGHSMGALLAYQVASHLKQNQSKSPAALIVSGCKGIPLSIIDKPIHQMEPIAFWEEIISLGGVSQETITDPLSREYLEPVLRADLKAIEDYAVGEPPVLDIPVIDITATEDPIYSRSQRKELATWQQLGIAGCTQFNIEGDHFFFYKNPMTLKKIFLIASAQLQ